LTLDLRIPQIQNNQFTGYQQVTRLREKNRHLKILISVGGPIKDFSDTGADGGQRKQGSILRNFKLAELNFIKKITDKNLFNSNGHNS
jgi:hypothetical protein